MDHVRGGRHGARSTRQAIAIGLSKARRAGVDLPPPKPGATSERTRTQAARDWAKGRSSPPHKPSKKRSRAVLAALRREGKSAASQAALGRQARTSAQNRGAAGRKSAARKAVRTKGAAGLRSAARKAARTRAMR
ncbi:MAG TPA: DUF6496 domain-containing protein [Candidatus Sulfopaludibacter sp.]|nr:DUF6496 domain-containing protein [Candidatus Sulfopaludibacter sp.]